MSEFFYMRIFHRLSKNFLRSRAIQLLTFAVLFFQSSGPAFAAKEYHLLAQVDSSDETYDPFADYSEYDQSEEEEADVNFFRNGRFLVLGFALGQRSFTQNLSSLYSPGPTFGIFLSFFFDLRMALQIGVQLSDHGFEFSAPTSRVNGNVALTFIPINLKYYFNTKNVTKGLADLNPYMIGGFSQVYRTYTVPASDGLGRDSALSLDLGAGLEIPLMKRRAFFGVQGTYHYLSFKDRNTLIVLPDGTPTQARPNGDTWDLLGILGLNF